MRVLVLGADGYLGWPTCMYFSSRGHEVAGVDNHFRRQACAELDCEPLLPVADFWSRSQRWREVTGNSISAYIGDISDYDFLLSVFNETKPEVVIHYAEQPSAPYSMLDHEKAARTLGNNLLGTLALLHVVHEANPACHIIKLGTMGEYGTPNIDIEEGWLQVRHNGREDVFLFPRQAGSLYHTTKIQDTDMMWLYVRTWGLRATDLMQGPVYGIASQETGIDPLFNTFFNYDEIFGTVLNRFVVQAVAGHDLTVYGSGSQIRGYIDLRDTLQCVYLAAMHPAGEGELRIFNQFTETFSVNELAARVQQAGAALGCAVGIANCPNPRVEAEEHYYNPRHSGLAKLGLQPHFLTQESLMEMFASVIDYKGNIDTSKIFKGISWKKGPDRQQSAF